MGGSISVACPLAQLKRQPGASGAIKNKTLKTKQRVLVEVTIR